MRIGWIQEYKNFSERLSFVSKLSAFFILILSLFSLFDLFNFFREYPQLLKEFLETMELIPAIMFQLAVFIIFALRFGLLFLKTEKGFWINQGIWLIGVITLASYYFFSKPGSSPEFAIYQMTRIEIFKFASHPLEICGTLYLIFSAPFKSIILMFSIIKTK